MNTQILPSTQKVSSELVFTSATELTRLLRSRQLSSVELVKAYLAQINDQNSTLNAVITLDAEGALKKAEAADAALVNGECWGPLHGLPMTVKDALATAGMRTTFGDPDSDHYSPTTDAAVVQAVKHSGAIILGKTNIPRLSYDWQCQHPTAGRANNPWNLDCTPGGSSGGAAAALAAGFTPLELGSDVAGSIRLPAHFCGVCGLRPTEGSLSAAGHMAIPGMPHTIRNLAVVGPLARIIEDLQLLLFVLRQHELNAGRQALCVAPVPPRQPETIDLKGLKIAWTPQLGDIPTDAETQQVLQGFCQSLEKAGCQVEDVNVPEIHWEALLELWGLIQGCELSAHLPAAIRNTPLRRVLPQFYWQQQIGRSRLAGFLAKGMTLSVDEYLLLLDKRDRIIQQMDTFLSQYDGWLAPVAPIAAISHRKPGTPIKIDDADYAYADVFGMYLSTTAVLATPAVSFPVGQSQTGLLIGIQLHGRRWQDERVLAIAQTLSKHAKQRDVKPTA